ncbi:MmgE/PrpD family protein [Frigidibacter mobilis]|nr:MmgE/PrpD family protein [Frigidibacter mobilis]
MTMTLLTLPDLTVDLVPDLVALCRAELSAGERASAVLPVCDTLGALLGGACDPRMRALMATLSLSQAASPGMARLPGGTCWGAAADIALVLGMAAHLLDFDDDETEVAMAHLSAPSLSAALAVAGRSSFEPGMPEVIDAYLTGCKAMLLLGSAVNPALYLAGWHATSVLGVFGATAAAARLLALDEAATAQAFSLAASAACGPRGAFGGEGKPLQVGLAAGQGVRAALLAQAGWQGAEGHWPVRAAC